MLINFIVLIGGTLFLAAFLTPWAMNLLDLLMTDNPWPFSRVFNRVAMASALLVLILFRKRLNLKAVKESLKSFSAFQASTHVFLGFILATFSVCIMLLVLVYGSKDLLWTQDNINSLHFRIFRYTIAAVFISFIEELFFRVVLLNGLKSRMNFWSAATICSIIYALVHFIAPVKQWHYQGAPAWEGLYYLAAIFGQFWQPMLVPPLIGLFIVGMVLAVVIEKGKSIYYCIGLHAGWVLGVKITRFITDPTGDSMLANIVGHLEQYHLVALWEAWISIILVGFIALWYINKRAASKKSVV